MPLTLHARRCAIAITCVLAATAGCNKPSGAEAKAAAVKPSTDPVPPPLTSDRLEPTDLYHLRSVGAVQLSPDASRVAYAVVNSDHNGRPYSQVWVMNIASRQSSRLGRAEATASSPRWSPDGRAIAYVGGDGE